MTKITIYKNSKGIYKGLKSNGHAGYADYGQDIVCAAVSALIINLINSIEKLTEDNIEVVSDEKKGLIAIKFKNDITDKSKLLMDSLTLGLQGIENTYSSEYIRVIFKEV